MKVSPRLATFTLVSVLKNQGLFSQALDVLDALGKKGESLFLNTPQCVHKAGIPSYGKYRDMLFVSFVATPEKIDDIFHYEKDYYDCIWQCKNDLPKKFSKPKNIRETYNLYKSLSR